MNNPVYRMIYQNFLQSLYWIWLSCFISRWATVCLFYELKCGSNENLRRYLREGELVSMCVLQVVAIGGLTALIVYLGGSLDEWSALRPSRWHIPRYRMNRRLGSRQSWPERSGKDRNLWVSNHDSSDVHPIA